MSDYFKKPEQPSEYKSRFDPDVAAAAQAKREAERKANVEQLQKLQETNREHWRRVADEHRAKEKAKQEAKPQLNNRKQTNDYLRKHGYKWQKEYVDRDADALEWRDEGNYWTLWSPDGRIVNTQQALDEIERGIEVVKAEREAKRETNRQAEIAAERAKAEEEAHNAAELRKFDAQVQQIKADNTQVERIDIPYWTINSKPELRGSSTYRRYDVIKRATVNGFIAYCVITGTGYDDDGYYSYFCNAPGLTPIETSDSSDEYF